MKTKIIALLFASVLVSCGGSKKAIVYDQSRAPLSTNPFGQTYDLPTFEADTEEFFAATGIAEGAKSRMGVLQQAALANAQDLIRQKMKHAYKGMVSGYANYMGINTSTTAKTKMEQGGDQIIDAIINDTQAKSVKFSGVDEKGNVTCYVAVRISKKETADKIAKGLSEDEELKLRFQEEKYRKYMRERFKEYKENQQ
jgi:hypothetical protein